MFTYDNEVLPVAVCLNVLEHIVGLQVGRVHCIVLQFKSGISGTSKVPAVGPSRDSSQGSLRQRRVWDDRNLHDHTVTNLTQAKQEDMTNMTRDKHET